MARQDRVVSAGETMEAFPRYRWIILALNMMAHMVVIMTGLALAPLAPFVLGDLASSRTEIGMLISAMLVGGGIGSTPGGWLADRSVRWTLVGAQALLATVLFVISRTTSLELSLLLFMLGGLGFGAAVTSSTKAVGSWFPVNERAMALGLTMAAAPLGNVLISTILPSLGEAWGWRQAVLPVAAFALASSLACAVFFRRSPSEAKERRDGPQRGVAVWDIVKKKQTWLLSGASILMGAAEHSFRTYFLLHVTEVAFLPVVLGGWYLALAHGSGLVGRVGWGVAADRWFRGNREGVFTVLPLMASLALAVLALGWGSPWSLPVLAVILGVSATGWAGIWTLILMDRVSSGSAGQEIGLVMSFTYVGVVLGPVLFGRGVDVTGSYQVMWLALASITLPAALAGFLLGKFRNKTA